MKSYTNSEGVFDADWKTFVAENYVTNETWMAAQVLIQIQRHVLAIEGMKEHIF